MHARVQYLCSMNTTTASPAYYVTPVIRGYTVVSSQGDGEVEWFPTEAEADEKAAELNDPEADR
jgi:hypothetical protein